METRRRTAPSSGSAHGGRFARAFIVGSIGLSLAMGAVAAANAATVTLTWEGTTLAGSDKIGLFGAPTDSFASTSYSITYVFDTAVSYIENGTNGSQEVTGGTFFSPPRASPLISASITVNGVTLDIGGSYYGSYYIRTGAGSSVIQAEADPDKALDQGSHPHPYTANLFQRVFRPGDFYGLPLDKPASYAFTGADNPGGNFSFAYLDAGGNILEASGFGLAPASLTISTPIAPGVPESSTWVMMLIGFVGLSIAARRRRGGAVAA